MEEIFIHNNPRNTYDALKFHTKIGIFLFIKVIINYFPYYTR